MAGSRERSREVDFKSGDDVASQGRPVIILIIESIRIRGEPQDGSVSFRANIDFELGIVSFNALSPSSKFVTRDLNIIAFVSLYHTIIACKRGVRPDSPLRTQRLSGYGKRLRSQTIITFLLSLVINDFVQPRFRGGWQEIASAMLRRDY